VKPPTISSLSPMSGEAGTIVVITGEHFTDARSVGFSHGASASFTVICPTKIEATVPNGAQTGKISVSTPAGTATSSMNFEATATIGLRLAEYKRLITQTNLLGAGLLGGVALFAALHALKPLPEAIIATLFVIIVVLVAWVRGSIDYQRDLIEARKEEKKLKDSMTMLEAANEDYRIQQDFLLPSHLYRGAAILALFGASILIFFEWHSALAPTDLTKSLESIARELHETRNDLAKIAAAPTPPDLTKSLEPIASELHETRNDLAKIAAAPTPPDLTKSLESIASELHETRNDLHDIFGPRPASPDWPTLSWGGKGPQVEKLQKKLGVAPDGEFGPATKNAVITFQRDHNLQQDGIVGPRTWAALPP
jgi:hypothetical protein